MAYQFFQRVPTALCASLLLLATPLSFAEDGVTADTILIGQSGILSGPLSGTVTANNQAAQLYFDKVNAAGGIYGRKIKFISLDDELKPDKALANYKKLIEQDKVFVTFTGVGTGTTAAVLPYLEEKKVPLIGPIAVADSVRRMPSSQVYWMRAGYYDESEKMVEHLTTIGLTKIAVASLNNPGGKEVVTNIEAQLTKRNNKIVHAGFMENNGSNLSAMTAELIKAQPQAIILFIGGGASGDFVKKMVEGGYKGQIFCFSIVSGEIIAKVVGEKARGIVFSQVNQYPWDTSVKVIREYQDLVKAANLQINYNGVGAFISAKVMVEAMKRAGKDLTRDKLRAALESGPYDVGGVSFSFTSSNRVGSKFVELVMLNKDGRFLR